MAGRASGLVCGFAATALILLAPCSLPAKTYTYKVKHLHLMGSCQGRLVVGETDIRYESDYKPDARIWPYFEVKKVDRPQMRKLVIYTYEDQTLQFGRDKPFDFEFLDGNVSDELYNFIVTRLGRARSPEAPSAPRGGRWELAAKHKHLLDLGGCEGTLKITENYIEYVTPHSNDARLWKYLDIKRVSHNSAYSLSIHTYEDQTLLFGRDKVFRFQLKEPLEPQIYEFIRQHTNR